MIGKFVRSPDIAFWGLLLVVGVALFSNLGGWGVTETSEARYAEISWEMYQNGDLLHPRLLGIQHFDKPPVVYWITAFSYFLFGPTLFAARFFLQIVILLQLWLIYRLTILCFSDRKKALLAAIIYACFIGVIFSARALTTDAFLNTFVLASLYFWAKRRISGKMRWFYAAWLCLGIGFMTKGPVVFIVPVVVFPAMNRLWPISGRGLFWHHVGGLALFLAVALPWYLYLVLENEAFFHYFVVDHTINRFATNQFHRGEPFWFFVALLPVLTFPWIFVGIKSVKGLFRRPFGMTHLLWLWVLVPLFFFSLSHSKLVLYILPVFPAVAILGAHVWQQLSGSQQRRWNVVLLVYHLFLVGLLSATPWVMKEVRSYTVPMWIVILGMVGLVVFQLYNLIKPYRSIWVSALFTLLLALFSTFFLSSNPTLSNDFSHMARFVQSVLPAGGRIMVFNKRLPSVAFETRQMTCSIVAGSDDLDRETRFEVGQEWEKYLLQVNSPLLSEDHFFVNTVLIAKVREKENPYLQQLSQHYKQQKIINGWWVLYEAAY